MMNILRTFLCIFLLLFLAACVSGEDSADMPASEPSLQDAVIVENDNAHVEYVKAEQQTDGTWIFRVTISHPDTGWDDYADGWDVVLQDGSVLKRHPDDPFTRTLAHPHVDEQPFTRSQSGIKIPEEVHLVIVRAHDLKDGYGGQTVVVDLNVPQSDSYEVIRTD